MTEWQDVPVKDLAILVTQKVSPRSLSSGTRYVGLEHLDSNTSRVTSFGCSSDVTSDVAKYQAGDVLFGRLRPYLRKVVLAETEGTCSPEILVFRPIEESVLPGYLHALLSSEAVIEEAVRTSTGTRMPRTSPRDLLKMELSLPPLDVQRRIVDLVGALDANITALETEASAATDLLAASRRQLGAASEKVLLATHSGPGGIQIGPFGSQLHASEYTEEGVGVVMPQDVVDGTISTAKLRRVPSEVAERLSKHRLVPGDVVFPRRGDLTKRALITEEQDGWLCGTGCIRFRPSSEADSIFIFEALSSPHVSEWLVEHAVGTTMLNLNTSIVESVPIVKETPDSVELASTCLAISTLETQTQVEIDALRGLRSSLLPLLLSGEVEIPASYDALLELEMEVAA